MQGFCTIRVPVYEPTQVRPIISVSARDNQRYRHLVESLDHPAGMYARLTKGRTARSQLLGTNKSDFRRSCSVRVFLYSRFSFLRSDLFFTFALRFSPPPLLMVVTQTRVRTAGSPAPSKSKIRGLPFISQEDFGLYRRIPEVFPRENSPPKSPVKVWHGFINNLPQHSGGVGYELATGTRHLGCSGHSPTNTPGTEIEPLT